VGEVVSLLERRLRRERALKVAQNRDLANRLALVRLLDHNYRYRRAIERNRLRAAFAYLSPPSAAEVASRSLCDHVSG
jgi:hypothetical protein